MNSVDTFTTTARELVGLAHGQEPDGIFVQVDDLDHHTASGKRAIMPTLYTMTPDAVVSELGSTDIGTYAPDDEVTRHAFR